MFSRGQNDAIGQKLLEAYTHIPPRNQNSDWTPVLWSNLLSRCEVLFVVESVVF